MRPISHAMLEVGVAQADITPPVGAANRCWGAATHEVAGGVHRPLIACVWVIHSAPVTVLIGMDGSWWQGGRREAACRRAVAAAAATTPDRVLLCLSHSHAAVPLIDEVSPGPGSALLCGYLDSLPGRLATATRQAAAAIRPGILQAAYGCCPLAACRDQPHDGGWAVGHDPHTPADHTLALARLTELDGTPRALLVNYACHPTSLAWQNRLLSPDYIGALRAHLAQVYDVPLLFLQGAGGDLAPARQYSGDPAVADRNGDCLALSVRGALATLPPPGQTLRPQGLVSSGADLGCWLPADCDLSTAQAGLCRIEPRPTELPWRADFESGAELDAAIAASDGPTQERLRRRRRLRREFGDNDTLTLRLWGARFGELLFFGAPAENYSHLQRRLRRRYADRVVLVANHCNGGSGYLMPAELHQRRNFYPAWQSPLAAGSFEQLQARFEQLGDELLEGGEWRAQ